MSPRSPAFVLGLVGLLGLAAACSSTESPAQSPSQSVPDGTNPGGGDGWVPAPSEPGPQIPAVPEQDCPAPYDAPAKKPVAGENAGFEAAGQSRTFTLLLPPASFAGPRPILFAFHGTTESATKFIARAKLADFASRGFVVVAPNAANNGTFWPVWDAMRAPGTESATNPDVALFDKLLSCTAAHYPIDRSRVFATGHSAGGIFTNRLLRSRSKVLAGGIVASGVFDLTSPGNKDPLDPMTVVVTWGGDDDRYTGTTPNGVHVPAFSFVEQASLASKYYEREASVGQIACRGDNLGHAWLPINAWFSDLLLARPKGSAKAALSVAAIPSGAPASCAKGAYDLAPLPAVTCGSTTRAGCTEACQLFADCAVENRTVGTSLATQLGQIGFTQSSCSGCVQRCQQGATGASDPQALSCFQARQGAAQCGPGIEGASPLFQAVNECCAGKSDSKLCVDLCTTLEKNSAAKAFFPVCDAIVR